MPEPTQPDLQPMNWIGDWAGVRARLTPRRVAVVEGDEARRWTFAELDERARRVANGLLHLGLERGDVVAFIGGNRLEVIDLFLACGKLGLVLAPVSPRLAAGDVRGLLERIRPRALFVDPTCNDLAEQAGYPAGLKTRMDLDGDHGRFGAELLAGPADPINLPLALADVVLYIHTGGSTGLPKICVVTYRQMLWNAFELIVAAPEGLAGRRELLLFPLFHIGGWNTFLPVFHAGGRVVLTRGFDPGRVLSLVAAERINHFGAVEAMLNALSSAEDFPGADLSTLEAITSAGAPCSRRAMAPFWARGIGVFQAYGQTEAGPSNFVHGRLDTDWQDMLDHWDSVGTAFPHCDYRIVAAEQGDPVAPGHAGVLWLRSAHAFDGYLDDPARTAAVRRPEGWIDTGDLAVEDEYGYVRIVGRADDMYVSGGENIAPEEIEAVVLAHETVAEAGVVGVPDERWGQVGALAVVPVPGRRLDPDAFEHWLTERLAGFKRPRRLALMRALPRTGAGKLDRRALRAHFQQSGEGQ